MRTIADLNGSNLAGDGRNTPRLLNLLLIPVLYMLVETARERVTHHVPHHAADTEEGNGRDPGGSGVVPAK